MSNKQLSIEILESLLKDIVGDLEVKYDKNNAIYNENFKKGVEKMLQENLNYWKENYKESLNTNYEIKIS